MRDDAEHRWLEPTSTRDLSRHVSPDRLRGPRFERLARGVHRRAGGPRLDHGGRIAVVQAALVRPAVLAELSAAWALGARVAGDEDDVVVVPVPVERAPRRRAGLVVRRCRLERDDAVATALGWATSPARTAGDMLRTLPRRRAVAAADAVLRATGGRVEDVERAVARCAGTRGSATARALLPLLDPRAESPRESELRVLLVDAGLPAPVPQHEVHDDGHFVARLDLAWPHRRVAVEYDGRHHREQGQHSRDLARHNRLRALGWTVLQVDADALARPAELLAQLRALLGC